MLKIEEKDKKGSMAWLMLGFRPFFLGAAVFALLSMGLWLAMLDHGLILDAVAVSPTAWHGHEMVFGYGMAVIAGFLLTAVNNWTGIRTLTGPGLLALFLLWLSARLGWLLPLPLWLVAGADLLFGAWLSVALLWPVIRVRQWKQLGILAKVVLLLLANGLFYAGVFGLWQQGVHQGLYLGLFLVIALVMTMGRRVIPFFIEKGVGCPFQPKNWLWLDITSLLLFLAFTLVEVFFVMPDVGGALAAALCVLHAIRLWGWYTPAIWSKPLLWVLFVGYAWLVLGFGLRVLVWQAGLSPFLALHAYAVGGIGLISLGMMARVSLGHTGRDVFAPPSGLTPLFGLLLLSALCRVLGPLLWPAQYAGWLLGSQLLWLSGFAVFVLHFAPMLVRPRVDGRWG